MAVTPPPERIAVRVVYALPDRQWSRRVALAAPASVRDAIERSGLADEFPGLLDRVPAVGIFQRRCGLDAPLRDGDEVRVFRPLHIDPKEARRLRAARGRRGSGAG